MPSTVEPIDPAPMRARADQVFAGHEPGWHSRGSIVQALDHLEAVALALQGSGRHHAAAGAYAGLLLSISHHIEWQDECEYDEILARCVEVLERLIEAETDEARRAQMLDAFGEVLAFDILSGGYALDDLVGPPFLRRASLDQRRALAKYLGERLREIQREQQGGLGYPRRHVQHWIATLLPGEDPGAWMPSLQEALPHYKMQAEASIEKKNSRGDQEA